MSVKKILYITAGCGGLALGALGAVLPLLPAFPFLMLSAFCFARSSKRLDQWFRQTRLYRENLESFTAGEGMTVRAKIRVAGMVTCLMAIGFMIMLTKQILAGCLILIAVWILHILYFAFAVKTKADTDPA